jgi:catalase
MLSGVFQPAAGATALTRAPHVNQESTPVTVRFSNSAGIPQIPDNHPQGASPRGCAIRFHLGDHVHTDIIGHSTDGFPVRTGEDFAEFVNAARTSGPDAPKPTPIEQFLAAHPETIPFVTAPKPIPTSFARESYFSVTAHKFISASGETKHGRYRIRPDAGGQYLDPESASAQGPNFLFEELAGRIAAGPVKLNVVVQTAAEGDVVDDATVRWPEGRPEVVFGTVELTRILPEDDAEARRIIFDPIPRVDGIEASADPLLEVRAAVYLITGKKRREATGAAAAAAHA